MRVHLPRLELTQWSDLRVDEFEALARADRFGVHELTDDPTAADVVLFVQCHMVDWRLKQILNHQTARRHWPKVMVFDERDRPWLSTPGIYVSSPTSSFDYTRQRAWSYLRLPPHCSSKNTKSEPDLLFSFIGSSTAACRDSLLALRHPDAILEESTNFMFWDTTGHNFAERRERYEEVLTRSRFVLCPRGRGTSSIRLYETLAAGRVPVVISDEWVPPSGPDWQSCSLRVREREAESLIELIEEHDRDWEEMSRASAATYANFFGDDVMFHHIIELLVDLRNERRSSSRRLAIQTRGAVAAGREAWSGRSQR